MSERETDSQEHLGGLADFYKNKPEEAKYAVNKDGTVEFPAEHEELAQSLDKDETEVE